jgi:HSP20 family protein
MVITRFQPSPSLFSPLVEDVVLPLRRMGSLPRMPEADVIETKDQIRVLVELPGMEAKDIDLSLEKSVLTVSGEKREERDGEDDARTYHLSERRWGRFSRSFVLPREVEQDGIDAHFKDGVLTITIPKSEQARRRRIEIRNGQAKAIGAKGSE